MQGKVIPSNKQIPTASTWNTIYITVEWTLSGCVVLKQFNGSLVEYVPPSNKVPIVTVAPNAIIDDTANPIQPVHAIYIYI